MTRFGKLCGLQEQLKISSFYEQTTAEHCFNKAISFNCFLFYFMHEQKQAVFTWENFGLHGTGANPPDQVLMAKTDLQNHHHHQHH